MKHTDMVGRLVPKYPGISIWPAVNFDGFYVRVPGIEDFAVSGLEIIQQTNDDQVIAIIEGRIKTRMEHAK